MTDYGSDSGVPPAAPGSGFELAPAGRPHPARLGSPPSPNSGGGFLVPQVAVLPSPLRGWVGGGGPSFQLQAVPCSLFPVPCRSS